MLNTFLKQTGGTGVLKTVAITSLTGIMMKTEAEYEQGTGQKMFLD